MTGILLLVLPAAAAAVWARVAPRGALPATTALLVAGLLTGQGALLAAGFAIFSGAAMGGVLRRRGSAVAAVLAGTVPLAAGLLLAGPEAMSELRAGLARGFEDTLAVYRAMSLPPDELRRAEASLTGWKSALERLLPFVACLSVAASAALSYGLALVLTRLFRRPLAPRAPFTSLRLPDSAMWLLIGALALVAWGRDPVLTAGMNVAAILLTGYLLQGLAIARSWFQHRRIASALQWGLLLLGFLTLVPVALVLGLGVLDTWLNFRSRAHGPAT